MTVEEMLRGRLALLARHSSGSPRQHAYRKLMETVRFCNLIPVILFDEACDLKLQELRALRLRVGTQDLRIAATALAYGVPVVTQNFKDFSRVPGLEMEDWSV